MDDRQLEELAVERAKYKAEIKAAREERKKQKKARKEAKRAEREALAIEIKQAKVELKAKIKKIKADIKSIKLKYKGEIETAKKQNYSSKLLKNERIKEIKERKYDEILVLKNEKTDLKFNFGKKYNTLIWNLTKWTHGLRKEFSRIVWSSPANTFKYLLIVVIIVLILSGIFMLVNLVTEGIIN